MNLFAELQERVRKCGDDVNAIIEISNEMHKYNCRVCPRNMYQDATSKTICPAMRGKSCRRNFATRWWRSTVSAGIAIISRVSFGGVQRGLWAI